MIWTAMVPGEFFRQMGVEPPVESSAEAIVEGEKIKSFTATNPAAPYLSIGARPIGEHRGGSGCWLHSYSPKHIEGLFLELRQQRAHREVNRCMRPPR